MGFSVLKSFPKARRHPLHAYFFPLLFLKFLGTVAFLWVFYRHYPGNDSARYLYDALFLAEQAKGEPLRFWQFCVGSEIRVGIDWLLAMYNQNPRGVFVVKLLTALLWLGVPNGTALHFVLSGFAFWGSWQLSRSVLHYFPAQRKAVLCSFFLYPTLIFWTGGVLKEPLFWGAWAAGSAFLLAWYMEKRWRWRYLFVLPLFGLVLKVKFYFFGLSFFFFALAFFFRFFPELTKKRYWAIPLLFGALLLVMGQLHPWLSPKVAVETLVENHRVHLRASSPGGYAVYEGIAEGSYAALLTNAPKALFTGLFRPLPSGGGVRNWVAGVESLLLLGLFGVAFYFSLLRKRHLFFFQQKEEVKVLYLCAWGYVLCAACLIALSTPNFGALVRYRVGWGGLFVFLVCVSLPKSKKTIKSALLSG